MTGFLLEWADPAKEMMAAHLYVVIGNAHGLGNFHTQNFPGGNLKKATNWFG